MPHLGERTDPAVDAIGHRLGELGLSRWLAQYAPLGLAAVTAWSIRKAAELYGPERFIDDVASLVMAMFWDNERLWRAIDRRVAAGINRAVRSRLRAIIYGDESDA